MGGNHDVTRSGLLTTIHRLSQKLTSGNLAVVAARAGVGKSASLVQIALADLVEQRQVLHVSLDHPVSHVRRSYNQLLERIHQDFRLSLHELRYLVERHRHIHSYLDHSFSPQRLEDSHRFLKNHMDFDARLILLDGSSLTQQAPEMLESLQAVAQRTGATLWLSAITHRDTPAADADSLPPPLPAWAPWLQTAVVLEPHQRGVGVRLWERNSGKTEPTWTALPEPLDAVSLFIPASL